MSGLDDDRNNSRWDEEPLTRDSRVTYQLDTVFELLRTPYRRYLLYYLYDVDDAVVSVEQAVEAVQRYEAAGAETDERSDKESVRLSLLNVQLPKLASVGVIDHDSERGKIRFWGHEPIDEWLYHARYLEFD